MAELDQNQRQNLEPQRTILYQTDFFEVVSIEWTPESVTAVHNHGWSQCLVQVEEGEFENTLDLGFKIEVQSYTPGQVLNTPVGAKHEMRCLSTKGRTLHIYTPRISAHSEGEEIFKIESLAALKADLQLSQGVSVEKLRDILADIRQHSVSTHSPYFMNQLFSGVLPQMLLAEELISQTKTTLATYEASPALSAVEAEVVEALGAVIGWPKGYREGVCVPGGSAANFMAVHCARQKMFPHIKKQGLTGEKLKIFVSSEAHYSLKKACMALGLGTDALVIVPTDSSGKMRMEDLSRGIQEQKEASAIPLMVCATAGTTVLGAFDPIVEISKICRANNIWLHIDGAWGGPALFSKQTRRLVQGIELADSVAFDAHKLFGANLTCSFLLTQHEQLLLEANDVSGGDYLFHSDDEAIDRGKFSWQCGRRADALSFWTIWKSLGTEGLGQSVDGLLEVRDESLLWIQTQARLQLVTPPDYLNLCVRVLPPLGEVSADWSQKVRQSLKDKNLAMVNYSANADGTFLRLILAHPFLRFENVRQILEWALEYK
jgi:glutamate/tyrosine decarboxylase-like PLP-dependent enzyme/quercetin dioxygenase-like cupin family protein